MSKLILLLLIVPVVLSFPPSTFFSRQNNSPRAQSGCGICAIFYGILMQTKEIYGLTSNETVTRLCSYFHDVLHVSCLAFIEEQGPEIIAQLDATTNPDVACYNIGRCVPDPGQEYCHMFPLPKEGMEVAIRNAREKTKHLQKQSKPKVSICDVPIIDEVCSEFNETTGHNAVFDEDDDYFSIRHTFRGYDWRGVDCSDTNPEFYPGRIPINQDAVNDSNCNSIYGTNPTTQKAYEEELCENSGPLGVILISDSAGAHFHIPGDWLDAAKLDNETLVNLTYVLENEADWPHLSFATGYVNLSWPIVEDEPTNSIYWRLRNRNLCNHNDYHNIAYNGADSINVLRGLIYNVTRQRGADKPALVIYSMFGNDLCSSGSDTLDVMTKPDDFRRNVMETLTNLDQYLPAGSHVVLVGPLQGEVLYPAMRDHIYPVGRLHNDVTYGSFYSFLACLETAACYGWQTANETLRNLTSERANELSAQMFDIQATETFQNFDIYATRVPVLELAEELGDQLYTLVEEVDGFHPDREAQNIFADFLWNDLLEKAPHFLGNENPNNPLIHSLFGL